MSDPSRCAAVLAAALDSFVVPLFIVQTGAAIVHLNEAARSLLGTRNWLRVVGGRLAAGEALAGAQLEAAIERALGAAPLASMFAARGASDPAFELSVVPLKAASDAADAWETPLALVAVAELRHDADAIARRMRVLYGLTMAEARVVADLAAGRTLEEIALGYGVRASTVRSQLRSVFAKTGATRQAELVRLALAGAPLKPD